MSMDDATVTALVDAGGFGAAKTAAMRAHATQISVDGPFFALSDNQGLEVMAVEYYQQVRGPRGPVVDTGTPMGEVELDLFAGLSEVK